MRGIEILLFGTLAGGVHLGAFALWSPQIAGGADGGAEGAASISLQAAPAQLAAMVEQWQTPPATHTPIAAPPRAPTAPSAPHMSLQTVPQPVASTPTALHHPTPLSSEDVQILQPGPRVTPAVPQSPSGTVPQLFSAAQPHTPAPSSDFPRATPRMMPVPSQPDVPRIDTQIDTQSPTPTDAAPMASARPVTKPARAAQSSAAPVPDTRAAGSGKTARAATGQTKAEHGSEGHSVAATRRLEAAWGASIQAEVQRNARNPGVGPATVQVQLQVAPSGKLVGLGVARSSGLAAADSAALKAVKRARRFAAAPDALDKARYVFQITLRFQ